MPDIEQKLYQLIINRLDGERLSSTSYQEEILSLVEKGIGGFIVFGGEKDEAKNWIAHLQSLSKNPLFIASDIERGAGQQIDGSSLFPGQMAIAAATDIHNFNSVKVLGDVIKAIACESIDLGINMPLIPVLDVNKNPDNPIICTRAFSDNPAVVAWYGRMYVRTLQKKGLLSCAKHFPGHGDTAIDSHISLPVISKSFRELNDADLFPFIEAVKTGVSSIMIGHLTVPALDDIPASFSSRVITDLLRIELGYEGLILTDALNMHALNRFHNVPAMCLNAGVDILLHPVDAHSVVEELKRSLASGEIREEIIDTAIERILKYKSKIKNIGETEVNYCKHAVLSASISDMAITLVKEKPGMLPLEDMQNTSLLYTADENRHDLSAMKNIIPESINVRDYNGAHLQDTIIIVLFTSIAAWAGSSGVRSDEITLIKELIKKSHNSFVISFGSPYVLRHFPEADILIAAYDTSQQAQSSVIKCLNGEITVTGKLPVTL